VVPVAVSLSLNHPDDKGEIQPNTPLLLLVDNLKTRNYCAVVSMD